MKPSNVLQDGSGPAAKKPFHIGVQVWVGEWIWLRLYSGHMFQCVRYGSILTFSVVSKFSFGQ